MCNILVPRYWLDILEEPAFVMILRWEVDRKSSISSFETAMDIPMSYGIVPPLIDVHIWLGEKLIA
jgi:hypothetical protein